MGSTTQAWLEPASGHLLTSLVSYVEGEGGSPGLWAGSLCPSWHDLVYWAGGSAGLRTDLHVGGPAAPVLLTVGSAHDRQDRLL